MSAGTSASSSSATCKASVAEHGITDPQFAKDSSAAIWSRLLELATRNRKVKILQRGVPFVIMVVGVNGVGKTTSIAKLAAYHQRFGRTVMLAAGDTFRAAAIDQLKVWGERLDVPVIAHEQGSDPGRGRLRCDAGRAQPQRRRADRRYRRPAAQQSRI